MALPLDEYVECREALLPGGLASIPGPAGQGFELRNPLRLKLLGAMRLALPLDPSSELEPEFVVGLWDAGVALALGVGGKRQIAFCLGDRSCK